METIECEFCKKEFKVYKSTNRRFCDWECYWNSLRGRKMPEETRQKISKANKGRERPIGAGKKKGHKTSEETKIKLSKARLGKPNLKLRGRKVTWADKISKTLMGRKQPPELVKKRLRRREKSSLEIRFEEMIKELKLPYKFVGNGDLFIAKKCPDFVNTNGEKIVVEVFARVHKEKFREGGLEKWKSERKKIFNDGGWEIIFFNETELNDNTLIKQRLGV
jgi:very-short-patch-repair endonuclease